MLTNLFLGNYDLYRNSTCLLYFAKLKPCEEEKKALKREK